MEDTFDYLYREGETCPKMMSVGLHCRIVGRPGRMHGLDELIRYAQQQPVRQAERDRTLVAAGSSRNMDVFPDRPD